MLAVGFPANSVWEMEVVGNQGARCRFPADSRSPSQLPAADRLPPQPQLTFAAPLTAGYGAWGITAPVAERQVIVRCGSSTPGGTLTTTTLLTTGTVAVKPR